MHINYNFVKLLIFLVTWFSFSLIFRCWNIWSSFVIKVLSRFFSIISSTLHIYHTTVIYLFFRPILYTFSIFSNNELQIISFHKYYFILHKITICIILHHYSVCFNADEKQLQVIWRLITYIATRSIKCPIYSTGHPLIHSFWFFSFPASFKYSDLFWRQTVHRSTNCNGAHWNCNEPFIAPLCREC